LCRHIAPRSTKMVCSRLSEVGMPLLKSCYGIGLSWDRRRGVHAVDLDLQAFVVNDSGLVVGAIYKNNLSLYRHAITHTGDETTGDLPGDDEMVWVRLDRLPQHVRLIVFVIAAKAGGRISDAQNVAVRLVEDYFWNSKSKISLHNGGNVEKDAVAMMTRDDDHTWYLRRAKLTAQEGHSIMEALNPKRFTSALPKDQIFKPPPRNTSDLQCLELDPFLNRLNVGIGWQLRPTLTANLEVAVILYNQEGRRVGALDSTKKTLAGLKLTGGRGDDKLVVSVDLTTVSMNVEHIFFVANITTEGRTFHDLQSAYCRVWHCEDRCVAHCAFEELGCKPGLIVCRLFRAHESWKFEVCDIFFNGHTSNDDSCFKEMDHLVFLGEMKRCAGLSPRRRIASVDTFRS